MITIRQITNEDQPVVLTLITAAGLEVDDVEFDTQQFWIAESDGEIAGCIGLQHAGKYGLLRSLSVEKEYRNRGIARMLIDHLIKNAHDIAELFLLTQTVDQYFARHGFVRVPREEAPPEIQQTKQFAMLCPSSAILMKKK